RARQLLGEPPVDLDRRDARARLEQAEGERAEPGAHLDDVLAPRDARGTHDLAHRVAVDHEVLPELLGGLQVECVGEVADLGGPEQPAHARCSARRSSAVCGSNGPGGGSTGSSSQCPYTASVLEVMSAASIEASVPRCAAIARSVCGMR